MVSLNPLKALPLLLNKIVCYARLLFNNGGVFLEYLQQHLPAAGMHKIYFDHGTVCLDAMYEPYQRKVDKMMIDKGYREGNNTLKFQGADHSEKAWAVHQPVEFLLGRYSKEP
jgi:hypothetical protein